MKELFIKHLLRAIEKVEVMRNDELSLELNKSNRNIYYILVSIILPFKMISMFESNLNEDCIKQTGIDIEGIDRDLLENKDSLNSYKIRELINKIEQFKKFIQTAITQS